MNRDEYAALRGAARRAVRTLDIRFDMGASRDVVERDRRTAETASARVPGGLSKPYAYNGWYLLESFRERRNVVRNAVRLRHIAERERAMQPVVMARRVA